MYFTESIQLIKSDMYFAFFRDMYFAFFLFVERAMCILVIQRGQVYFKHFK
jgi:hypothetical protein